MTETNRPVSFALGEHDRSFIADMVRNGRFGNRTEVVRSALRLLQDYENDQKTKRLRALIDEGLADVSAGRVTEYASADDMANSIIKRGMDVSAILIPSNILTKNHSKYF
ncbi:MAG: type II toxin-antitoxin system ParD family antitoxin [Gammaproteobacteria bacterium]|nr:type II toxin-antitoxin system ParD family antitoxin [Gammaproteobacteria bacterium]